MNAQNEVKHIWADMLKHLVNDLYFVSFIKKMTVNIRYIHNDISIT